MQKKVIQMPFNNTFFLASHKAIWGFSNKKHIKSYVFYTTLSVLILISGVMFDRHDAFPVGIVLGSGLLVYLFLKWSEFFERRAKYFNKVKKQTSCFEEKSMDCTYTFSDDSFEYFDEEKSFRLNWSLFKPLTFYKDNILLLLKDGGVSFTISRQELGDSEYDELCGILKEKLCQE